MRPLAPISQHKLSFAILLLACLMASHPLHAQQQDAGYCAKVKLQIQQELALERIGFEARLEITNNDLNDPLTAFSAQLSFEDPALTTDQVTNDAGALFFVQPPQLSGVTRVDGTGVIGPGKTAVVRWFIIPKIQAGGNTPTGKIYLVGANLAGNFQGAPIPERTLTVFEDSITVLPEPQLKITYFQPTDVSGDDPFTPTVESPIPFTLGVLVENTGYGTAKSVVIDSQQPEIIENRNGLHLVAQLLRSRVQDVPNPQPGLTVNLGDIKPGEIRKGAWDMVTSVSGEFIEFKAAYTHASELGGLETSVIASIDAHFIAAEVLDDTGNHDNLLDFLADTDRDEAQLPETLFLSNGGTRPVTHAQAELQAPLVDDQARIGFQSNYDGHVYLRIEDPGQAMLPIQSVVRSDGKLLDSHNAWTHIRYEPLTNRKLTWLSIFDYAEAGSYSYTVTYGAVANDHTAPQTTLHFAGTVTEENGIYYVNRQTQMYFIAQDESPTTISYSLDGGPFQPAYPFSLQSVGQHSIAYFARDSNNNIEGNRLAVVELIDDAPQAPVFTLSEDSLVLAGDTLSVRPQQASIDFSLPASALSVDAHLEIFQGILARPRLQGVPPSPTPFTTATITVSGDFVDVYRYRLQGQTWSAEYNVNLPLALSNLAGDVELQVQARALRGSYPTDWLSVVWTVNPSAPPLLVSGSAQPELSAAISLDFSGSGVSDYRWNLDNSYFRAQAPASETLQLGPLEPGSHQLAIITRRGGSWQPTTSPTIVRLNHDPLYAANFDGLVRVRSNHFPAAQGSSHQLDWDGTDESGQPVAPGWYSLRLLLTDGLGRQFAQTRLIEVQALSPHPNDAVAAGRDLKSPHARGDLLVWQERPNGVWTIASRAISQPQQAPVVLSQANLNQENPHTDGRYVVWQGRHFNGSWDVYFIDTQTPGSLQQITQTPNVDEINAVVHWPWLVYQSRATDDPNAVWQLVAHNLLLAEVLLVDPSNADQLFPSLDQGRVVWDDRRNPGDGEIYFRNLEQGEILRVTADVDAQQFPVIDGNHIAWQDRRHGQWEIYGHDLRGHRSYRITNSPANENHPMLQSPWLLYEEDSLSLANFRVVDLDSLSGLPLTRSYSAKSKGVLAADQLFWQADDGGITHIYSANLPSLQPVFSSSNSVAITAAMADAYGDAFTLLSAWHNAAQINEITQFTTLTPQPESQSAQWLNGAPDGTNFDLQAGSFLWVNFPTNRILDLGSGPPPTVDLESGTHVLSYASFPLHYDAYRLLEQLGPDAVNAVRLLDSQSGTWHNLERVDGALIGPNFAIPRVAVLMLEINQNITNWRPL